MLLKLYFCKVIIKFQLLVLIVLSSIFLLLNLIERLNDVGMGTFTSIDALLVTLLNAPHLIIDLLPSTFLIGSVMAITSLQSSNELMIARVAGFPKYQLLIPLGILGILVTVLSFLAFQLLIPTLQTHAHKLTTKTILGTAVKSGQIWIKRENEILSINDISNSNQPQLIEIFKLKSTGKISSIIRANKAYISDNDEWLLLGVEQIKISSSGLNKTKRESLVWQGFINQNEYSKLIIPPKALSMTTLIRYLSNSEFVSVGQNLFRSELWKRLSLPLTIFAMSVIAIPIAGSALDTRQQSKRTVMAGIYAMLFFIFHQTISNFDQILGWPSLVSWTLPPLIIICLALFLARDDRF